MEALKGLGVAMVTPFREDQTVDYKALEKLANHLIDGGVNYLVVQGTTGEAATLSLAEKITVHEFVWEITAGRVPVVLGAGGNNTRSVINSFDQFDFKKVDAILSVSPAYNKPTQEGIYQHFKAVCAAAPVPVILYNVPSRTASNMTAETTLRIAHDCRNAVAIKEASGDLGQMGEIIAKRPDGFLVISGDDALTLPLLAIGGDGLISVAANAYPADWATLVQQGLQNDCHSAAAIHHRYAGFIRHIFAEGNPGGIKYALKLLGICEPHVRQPLWPISHNLKDKLSADSITLQPALNLEG